MDPPTNPYTGEPLTPENINQHPGPSLPVLLGIEYISIESGAVSARLDIRPDHLAPNGYLHAATVIALADSACGVGALASRPQGSTGFTTIELKSNFLGTARQGTIVARAHKVHGGRTTQVWDAEVLDEGTGAAIAAFRCTQLMIYPREGSAPPAASH